MTEPPRPPGEGGAGATPPDPTSPPPPAAANPMPGEAPSPGSAPPPSPPQYEPPTVPMANVPPPSGYPASGGYPPPGGGYPPPAGGYPPSGGYHGGPAPIGYANNDDKTWSLLAHFGGAVGVIVGGTLLGWLAPLIAMVSRGAQSPTVRAHSVAALNFQITWAIASALSWVLLAITCGLLFFVPMLVWLVPVIFGIVGGVKANEGQLYHYPASYPFVK